MINTSDISPESQADKQARKQVRVIKITTILSAFLFLAIIGACFYAILKPQNSYRVLQITFSMSIVTLGLLTISLVFLGQYRPKHRDDTLSQTMRKPKPLPSVYG